MPNPYFYRSRMTTEEFRRLIEYFVDDMTAAEAARRLRKQRNTINLIYNKIRERLAELTESKSPFTQVDSDGRRKGSYNGVEFIRGGEAVGALKPMIIGVFKHEQFSYLTPRPAAVLTEVLPDKDPDTVKRLSRGEYRIDRPFTYDDLLGTYFTFGVSGIDAPPVNFFHFLFSRMKSLYGIPPRTRYLHLKETEWKYNNQYGHPTAELLRLLKQRPL